MSVAALSERAVQQPMAARSKQSIDYKRGVCPCCSQPMLVMASQPEAPCVDCYVEEKPKLAIGTQPIPVDR